MPTRTERLALAGGLVLAGLVATAVLSPVLAGASGTVELSPSSGPVGTTVAFDGSDCVVDDDPEFTGDNIRVYFREISPASPVIGTGTVDTSDPSRQFAGTFEIPNSYYDFAAGEEVPVTPGDHAIVFDCSTFSHPGSDLSTTFTVTGSTTNTSTTVPPTATTAPSTSTTVPTTSTTTTTPGGGFEPPADPPADAVPFTTAPAGTVAPGGTVVIAEPGFDAGESVPVVLYSDPVVLDIPRADATGVVAGAFTIPESTPAGPHRLVLFGADTVRVVSLTVAASAEPAPITPVSSISLTG